MKAKAVTVLGLISLMSALPAAAETCTVGYYRVVDEGATSVWQPTDRPATDSQDSENAISVFMDATYLVELMVEERLRQTGRHSDVYMVPCEAVAVDNTSYDDLPPFGSWMWTPGYKPIPMLISTAVTVNGKPLPQVLRSLQQLVYSSHGGAR